MTQPTVEQMCRELLRVAIDDELVTETYESHDDARLKLMASLLQSMLDKVRVSRSMEKRIAAQTGDRPRLKPLVWRHPDVGYLTQKAESGLSDS